MNRQKEEKKVKKVYAYKVVRINGETSCNMQLLSNSLLIKEYKDGSIVEAYPGTPGIFLFKRLKDCKKFALDPIIWKIKRVIPLAPLKKVKEAFIIGANSIASCYDDDDLKDIMTIFYKGPSAMWPSNLGIQETPEGTYTCQKIQVVGDLVERGGKNLSAKVCGGKCCRRCPGIVYPSDIRGEKKKGIKKLLSSGKYAVDYWEGGMKGQTGKKAYYIRPVVKGYEGNLVHAGWGGECIFLTENGCSLSPWKRPRECRMPEPGKDECKQHARNKGRIVERWLPYGHIIDEVLEELGAF